MKLTILPSLNPIPYDEYRRAIIESGIKIVENTERDTLLTNRTLRNTSRVARSAISEEVLRIQRDTTKTIEDVRHLVAGDMDGGIWTVGQSQGLIHDIPTCAEAVASIMRQAEQVLQKYAARCVAA